MKQRSVKFCPAPAWEEKKLGCHQKLRGFARALPDRQRPFEFGASEEEQAGAATPRARRRIAERRGLLDRFAELRARGIPGRQAARQLGVSYSSVWRWARRIVPLTSRCGRRARFPLDQIPPWMLRKVLQLQAAGASNPSAWRAVAKLANCPAELARLLESARSIPANLLRATRLSVRRSEVRAAVTVFSGPNFVQLTAGQSSVGTRKSKPYEGNEKAKSPRAQKSPSGR